MATTATLVLRDHTHNFTVRHGARCATVGTVVAATLVRALPAHRPARPSGPQERIPPKSNKKTATGRATEHEHGAPGGGQDGPRSCNPWDPDAAGLAGHLGQEIPPQDQDTAQPVDADIDDTYQRVARALADAEADRREAAVLVRALPVGAAPRRHPRRPHHLQCRRAGAQARHLAPSTAPCRGTIERLDGRHPRQGARGRPHAEGRLRHRLRILDAAPARRVRRRRRRVHVRAAVVHGYLRQDVFHRVLGRRPPRRADGHVRRRPSRRAGLHPRQARGRPPAPVQPVAADHRRLHGRGRATTPTGRWRSRSTPRNRTTSTSTTSRAGRSGANGRRTSNYVSPRRRPGRLQDLRPHPRPAPVGHDHGLDLRLRRAGLHPDRPRQRDEQQLVVREHPRHQPLRRAAAAAVRRLPAGLGQPHQASCATRSPNRREFDWEEYREVVRVFTRMLDNVVEVNGLPLAAAARRDHAQAPPRHGLPRPGQHADHAAA